MPARELSPLLVTSPSVRSGTTLLQRLLCASTNALVYGEEVGKDLDLQLQILASRRLVYAHSRAHLAQRTADVLAGRGDGWIADLMPDIDAYLDALHEGAFAGLDACRRHAASAGRGVWGFKYPGWPPHLLRLLKDALPGTRVIYLHRGLGDTLRSAKAWHGFTDEAQSEAFCAQWRQHRAQTSAWAAGRDDVLVLALETLLADPESTIARLQAFAPIGDVDRGVLARRVNNAGDAALSPLAAGGYVAPATLSPREQAWVDAAEASLRDA